MADCFGFHDRLICLMSLYASLLLLSPVNRSISWHCPCSHASLSALAAFLAALHISLYSFSRSAEPCLLCLICLFFDARCSVRSEIQGLFGLQTVGRTSLTAC